MDGRKGWELYKQNYWMEGRKENVAAELLDGGKGREM